MYEPGTCSQCERPKYDCVCKDVDRMFADKPVMVTKLRDSKIFMIGLVILNFTGVLYNSMAAGLFLHLGQRGPAFVMAIFSLGNLACYNKARERLAQLKKPGGKS